MDDARTPRDPDHSGPSPSGLYDAAQGKRSVAKDHRTINEFAKRWPEMAATGPYHRAAMVRTVEYIAAQGIRQFIDLGSGRPAAPGQNLHELLPDCRFVYVENDPAAFEKCRALLSGADGIDFLEADARDVDDILDSAVVTKLINLDEPVGLIAFNLWHYVEDDPIALTRRYFERLPVGSALALAHAASDWLSEELSEALWEVFAPSISGGIWPRPASTIERIFEGLTVVEPGLVPAEHWRPDSPQPDPTDLRIITGVGFKR